MLMCHYRACRLKRDCNSSIAQWTCQQIEVNLPLDDSVQNLSSLSVIVQLHNCLKAFKVSFKAFLCPKILCQNGAWLHSSFSLVQKPHIGEVQRLHDRASSTCFWISAFSCWRYMLDVHKFYFCHANSCQTILKLLCLMIWLNTVLSCQSSYAMPIKHGLMVHSLCE